MARYLERAENIARFIDVNWHLTLDQPKNGCQEWRALVQVTGDNDIFLERYNAFSEENVTAFLMFDTDYPHSVISCLRAARENARGVRDILSIDLWEQINAFYHLVERAGKNPGRVSVNPNYFCQEIRLRGMMIDGITDGTMIHGEGWHFSRLGRFLERADKTSRFLDVKYFILLPDTSYVGTAIDDVQWVALLRATGGYSAYRQRYGRISPANVAEYLLFSRSFPRAILFSLAAAQRSLNAINGTPAGTYHDKAEQLLGKLSAQLAYTDISTVFSMGLHEFTDRLQIDINRVNDAIAEVFFGYDLKAPAGQSQDRVGAEA
jgi:uncharacterized alpha-E superfamily protein